MPGRIDARPAVTPRRPTAPAALLSKADIAKAFHNQLLPSGNKLGKAAATLDQTWADNNIMSGVVSTLSGKLPKKASAAELNALAGQMLQSGLDQTDGDDGVRTRGTVKFKSGPLDEAALQALSKTTARDGFCYDPANPDNAKGVRTELNPMIKALSAGSTPRAGWGANTPASRDLQIITASREVKVGDNDWRTATVSLLLNTRTNEFAGVYTRGGWD